MISLALSISRIKATSMNGKVSSFQKNLGQKTQTYFQGSQQCELQLFLILPHLKHLETFFSRILSNDFAGGGCKHYIKDALYLFHQSFLSQLASSLEICIHQIGLFCNLP
jgi:hypothetical protein